MNIGFIGLGIMGAPMAGHLLAAGHKLFTYVRKSVPPELSAATRCNSPADVAKQSEVVITMLPDTPDVAEELSVVKAKGAEDIDEALWRGFLGGLFGRPSARADRPEQITSAGRLLCGFAAEPLWTWQHVAADLGGFRVWLQQHRAELTTLRFGSFSSAS